MNSITRLQQQERIRLDVSRLEELYTDLGEANAENIVCRALEELAQRLSTAEKCYGERRLEAMRKYTRSLVAIAEQIGMLLLARVASDVTHCIDAGDDVALAATFSRLLRTGEHSLMQIWDLQDHGI